MKYLINTHPKLITQEWDYARNKLLDYKPNPANISYGSKTPVWWKCQAIIDGEKSHHSWLATPYSKIYKGSGCQICSNRQICPVDQCNSLQGTDPELAAQWNHEKTVNKQGEKFGPETITRGSTEDVWWLCQTKINGEDSHHTWVATPNARTSLKTGCPICTNQKICECGCNSFKGIYPGLLKEWYTERNQKLEIFPEKQSPHSGEMVWWICKNDKDNHHIWQTTIHNRTSGKKTGCPICAEKTTQNCDDICIKKLDAYFDIAGEFDNARNNSNPSKYKASSLKKVWWLCTKGKCGQHRWEASIKSRAIDGKGCPMCSKNKLCPCGCNSLTQCIETHSDILEEWSHEHNPLLKEFFPNSTKKVWWNCKNDNHHYWIAKLSNRMTNKTGCPICSGKMVCPCKKHCNSFEYLFPILSKEWNYELNEKKPDQYTYGSKEKVWWECNKNKHVWEARIYSRTRKNNLATGCPQCRESKLEKEFRKWAKKFDEKENFFYESQKKFKDCKFRLPLSFDFYIEYDNKRILVEVDGIQHMQMITFYNNNDKFDARVMKDLIKTWYAVKNNFYIIRISYNELGHIETIMNNYMNNIDNLKRINITDTSIFIYTIHQNINKKMSQDDLSLLQDEIIMYTDEQELE